MKAQSDLVQIIRPPDPEVKVERLVTKRRIHTAEYKLRILKELDVCRGVSGGVTSVLRREGLYSALVSDWRRQRDAGSLSAFSAKRGPKPRRLPEYLEFEKLKKVNIRLEERLRQASLIIEAQKKIAELLGNPIPPSPEDWS